MRNPARLLHRRSPRVLLTHQQRRLLQVDTATPGFAASPSLASDNAVTPALKTPSLVWKAYAEALKPFLTTDDDLSTRNLALYVASPFSLGIPGGKDVPREIKNQQIASICDRALTLDSPLLSDASGAPSYFETQLNYLASLETVSGSASNKAKLSAARQTLKDCQDAALAAYNADQARFAQMKSLDPTLAFTDWMKSYGIEYSSAWLDLQAQLESYKSLLGSSAGPLGAAMDLMLSARSKLVFQAGNNMACSAQDLGPALATDEAALQVDKNSIFYRPLYSISGYDRCIDSWISGFDTSKPPSLMLHLDLDAAKHSTWAALGFPKLDGSASKTSAPVQKVPTLPPGPAPPAAEKATPPWPSTMPIFGGDIPRWSQSPLGADSAVSFSRRDLDFGGSSPAKKIPTTPSTLAASVSLYGIQAFDVDRGFWNLDGIWNFRLAMGADDALQQPLMKIVRILCGYKVDLRVLFNRSSDAQGSSGSILGLPLSAGQRQDGTVHYRTENDSVLIPQVLAVLARKF